MGTTTPPLPSGTWIVGSPPCTWGQRCGPMPPNGACSVHPHAHGDNSSSLSGFFAPFGSPPCTWGQRRVFLRSPHAVGRFTPMHMGTTPSARDQRRSRPVHPHAHGDNPVDEAPGEESGRFTPMHMGTTGQHRRSELRDPGSPPCTWGQRRQPRHHLRSVRFTPMHMGTTSWPAMK